MLLVNQETQCGSKVLVVIVDGENCQVHVPLYL